MSQHSESSSNQSLSGSQDILQVQKMLFVYNAVLSGWSVRKVGNGKFEFKKDSSNREVNLEHYLRRFVINNLNIDSISTSSIGDKKNKE